MTKPKHPRLDPLPLDEREDYRTDTWLNKLERRLHREWKTLHGAPTGPAVRVG